MLFRPSFCCNCGEKVERAEWKLWTSRRFCDLCATDFTLQEFLPKGVILLASVISIFGLVSFFSRSADRANLVATKSFEGTPQHRSIEKAAVNTAQAPAPADNRPAQAANSIEDRRPQTLAAIPANATAKIPVAAADEVYICGAATKKGTPCSRRVRGNVRCWQHIGLPAMLPPNQLRVSR